MSITLAKTAGFCFGVNRAVQMVFDLLEQGERVCTLGPIIHNDQMVAELASRGVRVVERVEEVKPGEVLVIRSHGVPASVYKEAAARGVELADATCPFVAKIHKIVREAAQAGRTVLIAGDAAHKEVVGIRGHCEGASYVFSDEAALQELLEAHPEWGRAPLTVVSQTTLHAGVWRACQKILKKVCTNAIIFDTICNATASRQAEAAKLAEISDTMVVVGGRHSSNTAKLFHVCEANCKQTYFVETAAELKAEWFSASRRVGVVAGASTPAGIIKEVIQTMSEILQPGAEQEVEEMKSVQKSFEEMTDEEAFEASLNSLNTDQEVVGTVLAVSPTEIQVDIGRGLAGYVTASEYSSDPNVNLMDAVKVGDKLNLIILRTNDQEGIAMLSKRRFDAIAGWNDIVAAKDSQEILSGVVADVIKGGVVVMCKGVRVFIPASQATASRGESLDALKGKEVQFRIIEIGRGRRAVGSIRSVLREARKEAEEKFWATAGVGDTYTGVVKSLTSYGAFVDLGGVDGMIHISELSWQRIKNPAEVVSVGDTVEVYIKGLDPEKKKISLGYKKPEDNPWTILTNKYAVGDTVRVKIVSMTDYGAFARILPGVDGLIHISQIANKHVAKPQDELSIGQEVDAKIINIDTEKKRVSLSIRALLPEEATAPYESASEFAAAKPASVTGAEPEADSSAKEEPVTEPVAESSAKEQPAEMPAESAAVEATGEPAEAQEATAEPTAANDAAAADETEFSGKEDSAE